MWAGWVSEGREIRKFGEGRACRTGVGALVVAEDGYFLMVDVSICLLEGRSRRGVRGVDCCDGGCVVWAVVLAGVGGWEMGPLNGMHGGGGGLEC